jgi:hypothetical protein
MDLRLHSLQGALGIQEVCFAFSAHRRRAVLRQDAPELGGAGRELRGARRNKTLPRHRRGADAAGPRPHHHATGRLRPQGVRLEQLHPRSSFLNPGFCLRGARLDIEVPAGWSFANPHTLTPAQQEDGEASGHQLHGGAHHALRTLRLRDHRRPVAAHGPHAPAAPSPGGPGPPHRGRGGALPARAASGACANS